MQRLKTPKVVIVGVLLLSGCGAGGQRKQAVTFSNAGFEVPGLSSSPGEGWYSDEVLSGRSMSFPDDQNKVEGDLSLGVKTLKKRPVGLPSVARGIAIPAELQQHRDYQFTVSLKGDGLAYALLEAYVWNAQLESLKSIGKRRVPLTSSAWTSAHLELAVPQPYEKFFVFIYYPSEPDTTIWIDDAKVFAFSS